MVCILEMIVGLLIVLCVWNVYDIGEYRSERIYVRICGGVVGGGYNREDGRMSIS